MGPSWALPFGAAILVTVGATPVLRSLARFTDFVDNPGGHKSHRDPVPYLGGIALILGVLVGLTASPQLTRQVAVIAVGGPLIGILGLLDDHRTISPRYRFLIEFGAGAVVLALGLGITATGVPLLDGALTLIWIVGLTNAVNLLDNMDGLAAGVAGAASLALLALAVLGEQFGAASLAAAMVGACLGFLLYNRRPASIFMGDTGSLFLGFTLAVATIEVDPALTPPASFAVPLVLLALPVLDTTTVTLARLRRGRPVSLGGQDHLSHRLVARGFSPGIAVVVLVAVEAAVGALAVLAGREVVPLWTSVLACGVLLVGLTVYCAGAEVYDDKVIGVPKRLKQLILGGLGLVLLVAAPATITLGGAEAPGSAGPRGGIAAVHAVEHAGPADAPPSFR